MATLVLSTMPPVSMYVLLDTLNSMPFSKGYLFKSPGLASFRVSYVLLTSTT